MGELADGDPVTTTSPVKNGNRCQFLLQYTSLLGALITELLFDPAAAFGVAAATLARGIWPEYAIPFSRRVRDDLV